MKKILVFLLIAFMLSGCEQYYYESDAFRNELENKCEDFGKHVELETKFVQDYYGDYRSYLSGAECLVKYNGRWITKGLYNNGGMVVGGDNNNAFLRGYILRSILP